MRGTGHYSVCIPFIQFFLFFFIYCCLASVFSKCWQTNDKAKAAVLTVFNQTHGWTCMNSEWQHYCKHIYTVLLHVWTHIFDFSEKMLLFDQIRLWFCFQGQIHPRNHQSDEVLAIVPRPLITSSTKRSEKISNALFQESLVDSHEASHESLYVVYSFLAGLKTMFEICCTLDHLSLQFSIAVHQQLLQQPLETAKYNHHPCHSCYHHHHRYSITATSSSSL